jgi:hypothetical protein
LESEIQKHVNQTESIPGYVIVSPKDFKDLTGITPDIENPSEIMTKFGLLYIESKQDVERPIII